MTHANELNSTHWHHRASTVAAHPYKIWDDITMDFIDSLPTLQGKNSILVVVDKLSKSTHFIRLSHP